MKKNLHCRILKGKPKQHYLSIVLKFYLKKKIRLLFLKFHKPNEKTKVII